jgi:E3 ubiquitin-protein ligase BRE1
VEIETVGKAWSALEEKNSFKTFGELEERIVKLQGEKIKLEHKLASNHKQMTSLGNQAIAFKKQSDKQLEQIRKSEELEKNLMAQMRVMETSIAAKMLEIEKIKNSCSELEFTLAQSADTCQKSNQKYEQVMQNNIGSRDFTAKVGACGS